MVKAKRSLRQQRYSRHHPAVGRARLHRQLRTGAPLRRAISVDIALYQGVVPSKRPLLPGATVARIGNHQSTLRGVCIGDIQAKIAL